VVCVGGSAGGLQAYGSLLQHLPVDLGIAVVIVNHMRSAATTLHKILPRYTTMPVELLSERLVIEPNRVYIIPENRELHILDFLDWLNALPASGASASLNVPKRQCTFVRKPPAKELRQRGAW
jgi:chemotaxis response regulator CheB